MRIANIYLVAVLAVVLGIGVSASAADIEGTYSAKGTNPGGLGNYTGSVIISKTKDSYKVAWSVGTVYIGTGIVVDDILSVTFVTENRRSFGIVAYKILDSGKKLEGVWCAHNGQVLGKETLEKRKGNKIGPISGSPRITQKPVRGQMSKRPNIDLPKVNPGPIPSSNIAVTAKTVLAVGQAVQVKWKSSWWAGEILQLFPDGKVKIHYVGWNSSWDETVPRSRIQLYPISSPPRIIPKPVRGRSPKRSWGPEQATGAPDTPRAGDRPTAWASLNSSGGIEWLRTDFKKATSISEVRIRETYNPGTVSKVAAIVANGKERVLWEGQDPTTDAPADFTVKVDGDIVSKSIKIYLDTTRKRGWNEIDAVELVGKDGTRQWASQASASSTYAVRTSRPMPVYRPPRPVYRTSDPYDPFTEVRQKRVVVHLEGSKSVEGTFVRTTRGFILIKQPKLHKTVIVNVQKIIYLETVEASREE